MRTRMSHRTFAGLLAAGAAGLLATVSVGPLLPAFAQTNEATVTNLDEAWYLFAKEPLAQLPGGDPSCALPTGCNVAGNVTRPNSPRPENTLQVGAIAGEEDASAAFTLDTTEIPFDAVLTGGTATFPVAAQDRGTTRASEAQILGCLTTGFLLSSQDGGSFKDRPEFDCDKASSPLAAGSGEGGVLTFTMDLTPFITAWDLNGAAEPNNGISLVVAPEALEAGATFNVAFDGKRQPNGKPITSTVTYEVVEQPTEEPTDLPTDIPPDDQATEVPVDPSAEFNEDGSVEPSVPDSSSFDDSSSGSSGSSSSGSSGSIGSSSGSSSGFTGSSGTISPGSSGGFSGAGTAVPPQVAPGPDLAEDTAVAGGGGEPVAAPEAAGPVTEPIAAPGPPGTSPLLWVLLLLGAGLGGVVAWSLTRPVELPPERQGAVSRLVERRRSGLVLDAAPVPRTT